MVADDVDRGWAWVVMSSSAVILALLGAFVTATGIIQVELLKSFHSSQGLVALICSIAMSCQFLLGPVAGIVSDLLTHRVSIMTGAALVSVGLVAASFCQGLGSLLFFYGIVCGVGTGLCYTPTVTVISTYFHKYRTVASGICLAAPGVGILGAPYFVGWMIEAYGWRQAMAYFGCLIAQICVLAALFFPRSPCRIPRHCCTADARQPGSDDPGALVQSSIRNGGLKETADERAEEKSSMMGSQLMLGVSEMGSVMLSQYSLARSTRDVVVSDSIRQSIGRVLGRRLLWVVVVNQVLLTAGFSITIVLFPAFAQSVGGMSVSDIGPLYIMYGVSISVSRILGGFIFNFIPHHLIKALFCTQLAYATTLLLLPLFSSFSSLLVCKLFIGLTYGPSYSLIAPIVAAHMRSTDLSLAFGVATLGAGLGSVVAPPLAGAMYDSLGNYQVCFYVAGALVGAAALSVLYLSFINRHPSSPEDKSNQELSIATNQQSQKLLSTNPDTPVSANQKKDKLLSTNQEKCVPCNKEITDQNNPCVSQSVNR